MILAIDPGNIESAYVLVEDDLSKIVKKGKLPNNDMLNEIIALHIGYQINHIAIEMVASYGMAVGKTVFDTCVWIGRFYQLISKAGKTKLIYRKDEKMNLCNSMRAKDGNIIQALVDRFAPNTPNKGKGTKKNPGYFYGFKADIWQAMAVAVTYHDLYMKEVKS